MHLRRFFLVLLAIGGWTPASAENMVLDAVADTCLWELDSHYNFGGQSDLPAGTLGSQTNRSRSRALFRFDLSQLPDSGALITSAQLHLTVTRSPLDAASSTFALHRVLKPWSEGTKSGDLPGGQTATSGESTWNERLQGESPWATAGGQFGTDFSTAASATATVNGNGTYAFVFNAQGLADLQSMQADPANNYGWILVTQAEGTAKTARRFGAREGASGQPNLAITLAEPFQVSLESIRADVESEEIVILVTAVAAGAYELQRAISSAPDDWTTMLEKTAVDSGPLEFRGSTTGLEVAFFRVLGSPPQP